MSDEGTEADYMHACQLSALAGELYQDDPEFEVVTSHRNDRVFVGSRAACWDYKRKRGGYVRPFSGYDDEDYML